MPRNLCVSNESGRDLARACLVVAVVSLLFSVTPAEAIEVSYKGVTVTHLSYDVPAMTDQISARLTCRYPGGSEATLVSQPGAGAFVGPFEHTGLSAGDHQYTITATTKTGSDPAVDHYRGSVIAQMNSAIEGELLWSDSIDGADLGGASLDIQHVTVPTGLSLSITNTDLNYRMSIHELGAPLGTHDIKLEGTADLYVDTVDVQSQLDIVDCDRVSLTECGLEWDVTLTESAASFRKCTFERYLTTTDGDPTFNECVVKGNTVVNGGGPTFTDCGFWGIVELRGRTGMSLTGSVLMWGLRIEEPGPGGISWETQGSPSPTISNNSFLGDGISSSLTEPASPIAIAANYYGDADGWTDENSTFGFLGENGSYVGPIAHFNMSPALRNGPKLDFTYDRLPVLYSNEIYGQVVIPHDGGAKIRQGKPLLISCDVSVDDVEVRGARFYAMCDGVEYPATDPTKTLYRDRSDYGHPRLRVPAANTTVNFILPPLTKASTDVYLHADLSGLTSHEPGGTKNLGWIRATADAPYYFRFNIILCPIQIYLPGYKRTIPNATIFRAALERELQNRTPFTQKEYFMWKAHTYRYWALWGVHSYAMMNDISAKMNIQRQLISMMGDPVHLAVAILEPGALTGWLQGKDATGVNMAWRRGTVLIDEKKPDATVHEMGHSFDLYTEDEQYDLHPPLGLKLENCTAFSQFPATGNHDFGDQDSIRHLPPPGAKWAGGYDWYDIMGTGSTPDWPMPQTYEDFYTYLYGTLYSMDPAPDLTEASEADAKYGFQKDAPLAAGSKRLFISGAVEPCPGNPSNYRPILGSVSVLDVTGVADNAHWGSPPYSVPGRLTLEYGNGPGPGIQWDLWFDDSHLAFTVDIPDDSTWVTLTDYDYRTVLRVVESSVSNSIVSPTAGELPKEVTVEWSADSAPTPAGLAARESVPAGPSQPLTHLVMTSNDGGNSWLPMMLQQGLDVDLDTTILSSSDSVSLRVLSSSGLNSALSQVDGLSVPDRAPDVMIDSPAEGAVGNESTSWTLVAMAYDVEDGYVDQGVWTSSVDGVLGTSTTLDPLMLSLGQHLITFSATDTTAHTNSDSVTVNVAPPGLTEVGLSADSLVLAPDYFEYPVSQPSHLEVGTTYGAVLSVNNAGIPCTATVTLYLTEPGSGETVLTSAVTRVLAPFITLSIGKRFIPQVEGTYQLRATLDVIEPTDAIAANNTFTWTLSTAEGPELTFGAQSLDFGIHAIGQDYLRRVVTLTNDGDAPLVMGLIQIANDLTGDFSIETQPPVGLTLAPGASHTLAVRFVASVAGAQHADLRLPSNDASSPALLSLHGAATASQTPVDLQQLIGYLLTGSGPPESAWDRNGDGVIGISDITDLLGGL